MPEGVRGLVLGIEKFSLHNGPGIRSTLFLKGCPLGCIWCGNPESRLSEREIVYNRDLCVEGCTECVRVCPEDALTKKPAESLEAAASSEPAVLRRGLCTACGRCVTVCPSGALSAAGETMDADRAAELLLADRAFYEASGGGVTLSGGEPLSQAAFSHAVLERAGRAGVHRAVDTCGWGEWDDLERLTSEAELVLFDLKEADPELHRRWTGRKNGPILDNLRRLLELRPEIVRSRFPCIPGLNGSPERIDAMAALLSELGIRELDLLPYHRLGAGKYVQIGREYELSGTAAATKEQVRDAVSRFEDRGMKVRVVG